MPSPSGFFRPKQLSFSCASQQKPKESPSLRQMVLPSLPFQINLNRSAGLDGSGVTGTGSMNHSKLTPPPKSVKSTASSMACTA